ncbi:gonadotropin-releasing hormone II receptor [Caerostris darwini]|uniref:Gonadotropin-releasing hormone II receptor n=1 Tax=Caerostris darwini TaxID=1538125 RepID=A0AAV4WH56_9ARAC|nr:gonadotropin-releasing hormone II receptor [Caerostris darwini]
MTDPHIWVDNSTDLAINGTIAGWSNSRNNTVVNLLEFDEESRIEIIIYSILFVLSASGNVAVCVSLLRGRHRRSRIEEMILHLNIADLIVTFIMVPMEIFWRITMEWIAGDAACRIMMFFRAFGLYLSSMVLVCISIDRFTAIVYPLRVNVAQKRVKYMLRYAWICSFLSSVPQVSISKKI